MIKAECHLKKDDKVKIVAGRDKGKIGKIQRVYPKKKRVLVENINMVKKHLKPSMQNRQGGIVENEAPIDWSNAMLMCGKCIKPVRVKYQTLDDGKKVRKCVACDEIIDN